MTLLCGCAWQALVGTVALVGVSALVALVITWLVDRPRRKP